MKAFRLICLSLAALVITGCLTGEGMKLLTAIPEHLDTVISASKSVYKAATPISDEEEYYIGRSVAARILADYPLTQDRGLNEYVNLVGRSLVFYSGQPHTFGGYHFGVVDSGEINSFACPGGTIFITRGMIDAAASEDELASVLAHEIAHVVNRDGVSAVKTSYWTEAVAVIGTKAAQELTSSDTARLTGIFEGAVDDIVKTLVVKGYGRTQELRADETAAGYLAGSGYDPNALVSILDAMKKRGGGEGGLFKTHPSTVERKENLREKMPGVRPDRASEKTRTARFHSIAKK